MTKASVTQISKTILVRGARMGTGAYVGAQSISSPYAVIAATLVRMLWPWPMLVSPTIVAIAFLFSGAVGIFVGFYPAKKAASLDPIDGLRYE